MKRHYGMDWLRIGAFALLILYHIGMVFVPWGYHVKTAAPADWVTVPMLFTNPWRLTLLFVVSGYASRALWRKSSGAGGFMANRSWRLIVPLLFGVAVIVPPQAWVELTTQWPYRFDYWTFWTRHYWYFGQFGPIVLPTWNHLWFVGYLWLYTLGLALVASLPGGAWAQRTFDRAFAGTRVLWLPAAYLLMTQVVVFQRWSDSHDVFNDGVAHLAYFPAFLFGFALAGSEPVMRWIARLWKPALAIGLAGYATTAAIDIAYTGRIPWLPSRIMLAARYIQAWMMIAALIGIAEVYLNRDHRWRQMLTEAVFPFYLIHQTIIVVAMYWLLKLSLPAAAEFAILVPVTALGCWLFYRYGREVPWLRPLIGLRYARRDRPDPVPPVTSPEAA
ncbi:acyltransferase family protein [Sphingomonas suaedae]|uniref:Acyltransferase family protein n=1 Tax=Sphingomonas suaedae TaxID=2599297 RepID=A0A518RG17_9SPHN|nr:acyltransferase [Sphingomonas suaedae]QDX26398.1 acyltransferase family protein [Sphingomonas suaedae]